MSKSVQEAMTSEYTAQTRQKFTNISGTEKLATERAFVCCRQLPTALCLEPRAACRDRDSGPLNCIAREAIAANEALFLRFVAMMPTTAVSLAERAGGD